MKKISAVRPLALLLLACGSGASHAVSYTQNDVTLDINGTINGYYVYRDQQFTNRSTGATYSSQNSELTNGLLPGWINFVATTQANGQDIKAHFSFAPGINSNSQVVGLPSQNSNAPTPLGYAGTSSPFTQIDTRNVYFQFGNNNWGTLKFGRDIGLFGQQVILSDMTLIGVGGASNAGIPYNTTFGMIGHGYMYTGFQPQITYSTPVMNGFQLSAGIFQPSNFAGNETKTPGVQAQGTYDWKTSAANGRLWFGAVSQNTQCNSSFAGMNANTACTSAAFNATGLEFGGKAAIGNFEALAYGFTGSGLGLSTVGAQFNGGSDGHGNKTESRGYFLQGTYKAGDTKYGINYGQNTDHDGFLKTATSSDDIRNKAYTLGVYHALNKYVTLVGEFNEERITNLQGLNFDARNRTVSLGGIVFF